MWREVGMAPVSINLTKQTNNSSVKPLFILVKKLSDIRHLASNQSLLLQELDALPGLLVEHFYPVLQDLFLLFQVLDLLHVVFNTKVCVAAGFVHLLDLVVGAQVGLKYYSEEGHRDWCRMST